MHRVGLVTVAVGAFVVGPSMAAYADAPLVVDVPPTTVSVGDPCVKTAGDRITLTPSVSVTFGSGSGVYQNCP